MGAPQKQDQQQQQSQKQSQPSQVQNQSSQQQQPIARSGSQAIKATTPIRKSKYGASNYKLALPVRKSLVLPVQRSPQQGLPVVNRKPRRPSRKPRKKKRRVKPSNYNIDPNIQKATSPPRQPSNQQANKSLGQAGPVTPKPPASPPRPASPSTALAKKGSKGSFYKTTSSSARKSLDLAKLNPYAPIRVDPLTLNFDRLKRDGKKTPFDYRDIILAATSPSQLSFRQITEQYTVPDNNFASNDDIYKYRGYKKMGKIDEGAFGIVYKATRLIDYKGVAIKEVDLRRKRTKRVEEMKRELFVLQKIDHPNVVRFVEHFVIGQTLVIIMEFCSGGNLTTYLKKVSIGEEEALSLFRQMAIGIKVLHRKGIAHRDVKLNNFLLDAGRKTVKVSDFGLSVVSYKSPSNGLVMAKTYCGTEPYMAPELLRRNSQGMRSYYPIYADIWSLGVCLFAMLTRAFPFKMQLSQRGLFKAQTTRRWRFPRTTKTNLSEEIRDLVWHMLDPEPERRITINGVLSHPWLNRDQDYQLSVDEARSTRSKSSNK